jgi:PAS domain S-box-containing protein
MRHFPSTRFATSVEVPSGAQPGEALLADGDPRTASAPRPRMLKLLVICGIALIGVTLLVTGAMIVHFRDRDLVDGERELANAALILAERTDRTFEGLALIEASLVDRMRSLGIRSTEDFESRMSGHDVHLMLRDKISGLPHVSAIDLIAANGRLINSSRSPPPRPIDAVDADLKSLASDPALTSVVGEPVQEGSAGSWTTSLARKFTGADGRFIGVVQGSIELRHLEAFFAGVALGQNRSIALLRNDGTLLARHPDMGHVPGTKRPDGIAALGDRESVATRVASETGKDRLVALRRSTEYPLVISVGANVETMLNRWWQQSAVLLGAWTVRVLAICLIVFLAARLLVRGVERSKRRLQEQKRKLDAALNHMSQGLCMFDQAARLVLCNARYLQMYDLPPDAVTPGCTLRELLERRKVVGSFSGDVQTYVSELLASIAQGSEARRLAESSGGRIIEIVNQPMAGGGWIATHNDSTLQRRAEQDLEAARAKAECAEREARASHARLLEAFEVVPEGLALFDAENRYVLWNRRYEELYPGGHIAVGKRFEDALREGLATGAYPGVKGREEAWLAERLSRHAAVQSSHEQRLPGDRWVRVEERRTADGGSIGVRIDITELKRREASFRLLFESNPLPMHVYDAETLRFLAVNDAALAHYGYSRGQYLAMTVLDIRPAEDRDRFAADLPSFGDYHAAEGWRHQRSDGTIFDVDIYSRRMDYGGRPARFSAIVDITERRRAERERDRNREFLDLIIENVPSIILVKDIAEFRYILVNRAGERDCGVPRREMLGRTAHDVFPRDTAERFTALDKQALESRQTPLVSESVIEMPNGDRRRGIAKRLLIRDDDGAPQYLLTVVDDLTDRRRLEEERDRNREFLNAVIENVPATIFVRDAREQRYILVNRAAEALWGISRETIIGKTPRDLFSGKVADMIANYDRMLLQSDTRLVVEEHVVGTPNNGTRLVKVNRVSIRDRRGEPQYLLGVMEDITESRAVEQQLQQSQKMEAVGNLTGGLAHDFNNLLTVMIGNLDLLQSELAGHRTAEQKVATILQAAERGADLTHQLLAFSRRQHLSPRHIDVNDLISNTSRLLARTLGENISFDLRLVDDPWPVIADAGQLEAALVNIAINARDAMPDGGVLTIASKKSRLDADFVALHPGATAGDHVEIELRDTGDGMAPDVLAHIFEPFFTTKPPGKGTGLGLSMVYGFIQQSGGYIRAESKLGEGTTFKLYLPRATAAGTKSAAHEEHATAPAAAGKVILVVDDNPAVRATVLLQLKALGYAVYEADNAQSALSLLDEMEQIDLLFTDIVMPGPMNGRDLAAKARARRPDLKVLYTSGFPGALAGDRVDDRDELLNKPYRRRDLANAIHRVLHARSRLL